MKEEKMRGRLMTRYGLLVALGLGTTFIGTSSVWASEGEEPPAVEPPAPVVLPKLWDYNFNMGGEVVCVPSNQDTEHIEAGDRENPATSVTTLGNWYYNLPTGEMDWDHKIKDAKGETCLAYPFQQPGDHVTLTKPGGISALLDGADNDPFTVNVDRDVVVEIRKALKAGPAEDLNAGLNFNGALKAVRDHANEESVDRAISAITRAIDKKAATINTEEHANLSGALKTYLGSQKAKVISGDFDDIYGAMQNLYDGEDVADAGDHAEVAVEGMPEHLTYGQLRDAMDKFVARNYEGDDVCDDVKVREVLNEKAPDAAEDPADTAAISALDQSDRLLVQVENLDEQINDNKAVTTDVQTTNAFNESIKRYNDAKEVIQEATGNPLSGNISGVTDKLIKDCQEKFNGATRGLFNVDPSTASNGDYIVQPVFKGLTDNYSALENPTNGEGNGIFLKINANKNWQANNNVFVNFVSADKTQPFAANAVAVTTGAITVYNTSGQDVNLFVYNDMPKEAGEDEDVNDAAYTSPCIRTIDGDSKTVNLYINGYGDVGFGADPDDPEKPLYLKSLKVGSDHPISVMGKDSVESKALELGSVVFRSPVVSSDKVVVSTGDKLPEGSEDSISKVFAPEFTAPELSVFNSQWLAGTTKTADGIKFLGYSVLGSGDPVDVQPRDNKEAPISVYGGLALESDVTLALKKEKENEAGNENVYFSPIILKDGSEIDFGGKTVLLDDVSRYKRLNGVDIKNEASELPSILQVEKNCHATLSNSENLGILMARNRLGANLVTINENAILDFKDAITLNHGDAADGKGVALLLKDLSVANFNGKTTIEHGVIKLADGAKATLRFCLPEDYQAGDALLQLGEGAAQLPDLTGDNANNLTIEYNDFDFVYGKGYENAAAAYQTLIDAGTNLELSNVDFHDKIKVCSMFSGIDEAVAGSTVINLAKLQGQAPLANTPLSTATLTRVLPNIDSESIPDGVRDAILEAVLAGRDQANPIGNLYINLARPVDPQDTDDLYRNLLESKVEEKSRVALQIIDTVRDSIYDHVGEHIAANTRFNVWASVLGDTSRSKSDGYKVNTDIYGFAIGADAALNNNWTLGLAAGYSKAKSKFKGNYPIKAGETDKTDTKSYFGGVYGLWSDFVQDLDVKFSLLMGHLKFEDRYDALNWSAANMGDLGNILPASGKPKGYWISGNVDATYKHWNVGGFYLGPWAALSLANVHQKSFNESSTAVGGKNVWRHFNKANRRAIEITLGAAADYDFEFGTFKLALGWKHDFRHLSNGKIEINATDQNGNKFTDGLYKANTIAVNKNAFVIKAALDAKFNQNFGLDFGINGQLGKHFKDVSGSITASYSF